jgi:hypothetical protein
MICVAFMFFPNPVSAIFPGGRQNSKRPETCSEPRIINSAAYARIVDGMTKQEVYDIIGLPRDETGGKGESIGAPYVTGIGSVVENWVSCHCQVIVAFDEHGRVVFTICCE